MKLILDLDMVNKNLTESYELWNKIHNTHIKINSELIIFNSYYFNRLNKLNEYIAFDLKRFIDEVISIISIIKNKINNNKISISSIGDYLKKHDFTYNEFDIFLDLFTKLNDLINAYKHSYANTDFPALGQDNNCFIALYSPYNDFSKDLKYYIVPIDYIIIEFNKFYKESFKVIDTLTKKHNN